MTDATASPLQVDLGAEAYPIFIGETILADSDTWASVAHHDQVFVVTNALLAKHYLPAVQAGLGDYYSGSILIDDHERCKTWQTVEEIVSKLLKAGANRQTTLCALGGGVIGDITGFAAAIFQRGIRLIQIPTTLLAQVDAAVGGKTAINHPMGKNMMGAFHQPKAVVIDTETLSTLPEREFCAGLAEVVKYGLIVDSAFFDWLESNIKDILAREPQSLQTILHESCRHKAHIVQQDAAEKGIRALLNFGHTFAHAIEVGLGYGTLLHGEAVAIGMVMAARMSERVNGLAGQSVARLIALLQSINLPTCLPEALSVSNMLQYMALDKKNLTNKLRLILLKQIGHAYIYDSVDKNILHGVIRDSYA